MGRSNQVPDDIQTASKLYLEKLKWVCGDYDSGSVYWGGGTNDFIYRASGETNEEQIEIFVRAKNRDEAKLKVRSTFQNARFYR